MKGMCQMHGIWAKMRKIYPEQADFSLDLRLKLSCKSENLKISSVHLSIVIHEYASEWAHVG